MNAEPDFAGRRARTLARARRDGCSAMLVSDIVNVSYLTGFSGSNASLAIDDGGVWLITDGRYQDQAEQESPDVTVVVDRAVDLVGAQTLLARGADQVAIEAAHVSLADFRGLADQVGERHLVATTGLVEAVRRAKDAYELSCLTRAAELIDAAVAALLPEVRAGMTERQIARRLEWLMLELGADAIAFPTIVAGGANSAIPHHSPTHATVRAGDLLKIDAGAQYRGYHSDMTRTFVVGAEPSPRQRDLHEAVRSAAQAARDVVAAGVPVRVADEAARAALRDHGLEERFTHGLGHGVGLQIHEAPMVNATSTDTIGADDVLTIEPGVYVPGFGGVRIEDTLAVRANGSRSLTTTDRELVRLG